MEGPFPRQTLGCEDRRNWKLFVVDGGDQNEFWPDRARVLKLDPEGNVLASFGSYGKAAGSIHLAAYNCHRSGWRAVRGRSSDRHADLEVYKVNTKGDSKKNML